MSRRYVTKRLLRALVTVAAILVVSFVMVHLMPGDPVEALAGEGASLEQLEAIRTDLGLDRPAVEQLGIYVRNVMRGDLGVSFLRHEPVSRLIGLRVPATLLLMGTALAVSSVAGVALGVVAARRPFGRLDAGIGVGALVGYSLPAFWLAQVAVLVFAFGLHLFPVQGMVDARSGSSGLARSFEIARHLVLPASVLAVSEIALLTRLTRSRLIHELEQGYVRTAEAKGMERAQVLSRHALPNALLPVLTVIGTRIGFLLSGAVLVESVFSWPGLGTLLIESAVGRDQPVVLGMALLVAGGVVAANLLTDLAYACVDPRIRYT